MPNFKQKPVRGSNNAFTLIEVMLFLAISGALIGIAFAGLNNRTDSIRFTEAMRDIESKIKNEYTDIVNGVNIRPVADSSTPYLQILCPNAGSQRGASEDCIMQGQVIAFTENFIGVLPQIGIIDKNLKPNEINGNNLLQQFNLSHSGCTIGKGGGPRPFCVDSQVDNETEEQNLAAIAGALAEYGSTHDYLWGVKFIGGKVKLVLPGATVDANGVIEGEEIDFSSYTLGRSPYYDTVFPIVEVIQNPSEGINWVNRFTNEFSNANNDDPNALGNKYQNGYYEFYLCFEDASGRVAAITQAQNPTNDPIPETTNFDPAPAVTANDLVRVDFDHQRCNDMAGGS